MTPPPIYFRNAPVPQQVQAGQCRCPGKQTLTVDVLATQEFPVLAQRCDVSSVLLAFMHQQIQFAGAVRGRSSSTNVGKLEFPVWQTKTPSKRWGD